MWFAYYEHVANEMLKYLEDGEDLKFSFREWREQLESREEADIFFMQIAEQGRHDKRPETPPDLQATRE